MVLFPQAYFWRALAFHMNGQMLKGMFAQNAFKKCIEDSIMSYQMSGNTEHDRLLLAISTAVSRSKQNN